VGFAFFLFFLFFSFKFFLLCLRVLKVLLISVIAITVSRGQTGVSSVYGGLVIVQSTTPNLWGNATHGGSRG
jgi:hypothetical protein